jgi:hypothetical protein
MYDVLSSIYARFFYQRRSRFLSLLTRSGIYGRTKIDVITKLELFEALLAYILQSSTALDETARALAPDTLESAGFDVLVVSLDVARIVLSDVIHPYSNPFITRFLLRFIAVTRLKRKFSLELRKRR